jgi:hypothetical protein
MNTIKQTFIVIDRRDFLKLVDKATQTPRSLPIEKTALDVNLLIRESTDEKQRNNAIMATRYNLPFVIGDHIVIPVTQYTDPDLECGDFFTSFGGQRIGNVGE